MNGANTVFIKSYEAPPVDRREILRYAGVRVGTRELDATLDEALALTEGKLTYKVCYRTLPVRQTADGVDLGFLKIPSAALARSLAGCERAVLFAATVGVEIDRLIARYARISPATALFLQAIGTERVEALCDTFERDIGAANRPRFSPGYGDFPLEAQREIFALLDCARRIGLSLNESLLMSPQKSVTALIGIP